MKTFQQSLRCFLFMTLLLGLVYPIAMTGVAQLLFPTQANGSLVGHEGRTVGSALLGQPFKDPKYFWPRPSAVAYNPSASGASGLGPTSESLLAMIEERRALGAVGDLLFASGSGLDPHISLESARSQIERIVKARGSTPASTQTLVHLIKSSVENRQFGILGEPRINVLKLNLALDAL